MNKTEDLFEAEALQEMQQLEAANSGVKAEYEQTEEMKQGSKAWFIARSGKFTGSTYPDLLKGGRAKSDNWGLTALKVIQRVYIERDLTEPGLKMYIDAMFSKEFHQTKWGNDNEPLAREEYMVKEKCSVDETCFEVHPTIPFMGGSFDGKVVSKKKIIEIKCPYDILKHQANAELESIGEKHEYYGQIQGNIEIAGADSCDFISFDPRRNDNRLVIINVKRDQEFIDKLLDRIHIAEGAVAYMKMGIDVYGAVLLSEKDFNESKEVELLKQKELK